MASTQTLTNYREKRSCVDSTLQLSFTVLEDTYYPDIQVKLGLEAVFIKDGTKIFEVCQDKLVHNTGIVHPCSCQYYYVYICMRNMYT